MSEQYTGDDLDAITMPPAARERMIFERVEKELERIRLDFEREKPSERAMAFLQGKASALRTVISLPQLLRDEISSELKERDKHGR